MSTVYFDLSTGSLSQDWSNTNLVALNDDWSGVPSIQGYLGDVDAAAPTGVDPQTRTAAALGAVDVIANQTDTTINSGGVAEFEITNPTVALQGSGTADAPSLVFHLNATGRQDIRVRFDARDIDGTITGGTEENALQPIAVQFRTDPAADWTNVAYDADVTSLGVSETTAFDVALPVAAQNQPTLQVRVLTANAVGSDEWLGIDNIVVSSAPAGPVLPTLSIGDVSVSEDAGTATVTVTLSAASQDTVTVNYATADGSATAGSDYAAASGMLTFEPGTTSQSFTVSITDDAVPLEGGETFGLTLSDALNATLGDGIAQATIVDNEVPQVGSVSIADVAIAEGNGGTSTATFTVTRSGGIAAFAVDFATQDGTATAGSDFTSAAGNIAFAQGETTKTVSVTVTGDTAIEPTEQFGVVLSGITNGGSLADASGTGTIANDDFTRIFDIQGEGHVSALAGATVTTRGVVTAVDSNGFYVQDPMGDGDAATSDGVFVFTSSAPAVAVGQLAEITGTVEEFIPTGAATGSFSLTEIIATGAGAVQVVQDAAAAPDIAPVQIGGTGGLLPPTESLIAGGKFFESLEGMLVTVEGATAVGPTNNFGEIFTIVDDGDATNGTSATGDTAGGNLLLTPGFGDFGDTNTSGGDFNPERIQIDDDSGVLPGFATPKVNVGAQLGDVTGVVGYEFGNYQVTATQAYSVTQPSPLVKEDGTLEGAADQLLVASYNAENLDPTDGTARFDLIAGEILGALNTPDIVAMQEVQDGDGPGNTAGSNVTSAASTLQMLVDALNAAAPAGVEYAAIDNPFIGDDTNGGEPGGNIRTAFLYRTDRVDFEVGSLRTIAADGSPLTTADPDQQTNPDNPFFGSRPPLVATFGFNGQDVTIVNNHFTSKGGSAPLLGTDQPPLNAGEVQRAAQAQAVNDFVDGLIARDSQSKVIVAGDLNEFPSEEPMQVIKGLASVTNYDVPGSDTIAATADYTPGGTEVLSDLMDTLPADERYDYVFEGNSQTLDHILVSESLKTSAEFDVVHINSEFSDQTSDHDPLLARFLIAAADPVAILDQGDTALAGSVATPTGTDELTTSVLGTYATGSGAGSAEVIAFEASTDRLFVMNNVTDRIEIVNYANPANPVKTAEINVAALVPGYDAAEGGSGMNSIAISNGVLAVAIEAPTKSDPGLVALFSTADGSLIKTLTVGSLPDMLTFTPDGQKLIVANEGENPDDGEVESAGSISLIDVSGGAVNATVTTVGFGALDGREGELRSAGVRLYEGLSASIGLEPEYIDFSADGTTAYVTLQENNAVATFDISGASPVLTSVLPLGYVDHAIAGNEGDFSDRDGPGTGGMSAGAINIVAAPIKGLLMPDALASWTFGGVTYFATANEGDSRVDGSDETRLSGLDLNDGVFANGQEAALKGEDAAGRLTVSNIDGDTNSATPGNEEIYTFGGRSMSIFRQETDGTITKVSDTGGEFEKIIAELSQDPNSGIVFNTNGEDETPSFDNRSDNKAGEPEGIEVAEIGGKVYAFVGLERQGGVMVYNVTDPASPTYVKYLAPASGDRGPEVLKYIAAQDSPTGEGVLLAANEYSGTVTAYEVDMAQPENFRLQILHASDFEAGLDAVDRAGNFAAIVDYLEETETNSITLSSGDNFLPSPFFNAGSDASLKETYETALEDYYNLAAGTLNITPGFGTADISMLNIIGVQASAIGNHEFDAGTNPLAAIMRQTAGFPGAQFPYLSANLDFSGDPNLNPLFTSTIRDAADYGGFPPAVGVGNANKKIAPATIITENGEKIGVVGATTQIVESISSTGGVEVIGPDANDMPALAAILQPTIDALIAQGINKIIVTSHLQQIALEKALAPLLRGVDVIISGGSNTLLADSQDTLRPGDTADDVYPLPTTGADGKTTLIVNTDGEYSYVGRLVVEFDANGDIVPGSVDPNVSGAFATTDAGVDALYDTPIDIDGDGDLDSDPFASGTRGDLVNDIAQGVGAVIDAQDGNTFGQTDVYLEGRRGEVRTQETNLGNLSADANLWYAQKADDTVLVSIKNGGGIRDSIGRVEAVGGDVSELPPGANPGVGKAEGDVSQLDIANSLRFNNALSLITLTPEQLLQVLEHAVTATAPGATPGQFAQIGGISYSFDADLPAGERVVSAALIDENGDATTVLVREGEVVADAPAAIRVATLSFLVTGGDGYPFPSFVTADPSFANVVNLSPELVPDAGQVASFAAEGTEQDALAEYLDAFFTDTPYGELDTAPADDERIQNLDVRQDTVFEGPSTEQTVTLEQGAFAIPLGIVPLTDPENDPIVYTVTAVPSAGDGTVSLRPGGPALTVGTTLNAARLALLVYTAADDGAPATIGFSASDGMNTQTLTVSLDVQTAQSKSYVGTPGMDRLDGAAGNDVVRGLAGTDTLVGGSGNDQLIGGIGTDTMTGGAGNDTYVVDDFGDRVIEVAGDGSDTILTAVDYKLASAEDIEVLSGANLSTTRSLNLVGNELAQSIYGNAGANVLDGKGGADLLRGLGGDDTYVVDDVGDIAIDVANGGIDTVKSFVSFTVGANIEKLTLIGTGSVDATGNASENTLTGNAGANVLAGGLGNDTLRGGAGNDTFVFDTTLRSSNVDHIRDFSSAQDTIQLENGIFRGLAAGGLTAGAFKDITDGAALDADDRILYDQDSGQLFFDADGGGARARVEFAVIDNDPILTFQDFVVV